MPLHTPLSLLCSVVSAGLGTFVLARDARTLANRALAVLFFAIAWWAFSEFMWNNADSAAGALRWLKIGGPGYIFIGAFYLRFTLAFTAREALLRRPAVIGGLFGLPVLVTVLTASGFTLFNDVSRTFWGCFSLGIWLNYRFVKEARTRPEREQARLTLFSMLVPIVMGVLTDGILPVLEVQLFRLGTVVATFVFSVFVYAMIRYQAPLLTPESVSEKVLGTIPEAVFLVDATGTLRHANAAAAALTGRTEEALKGIHIKELIEATSASADRKDPPLSALRDLRDVETTLRVRDGRRIPVALSTSTLYEADGHLVGLVGVARDLSSLKRLQAQVLRSEKMAAVGKLASGIGHEVNNPITYIRMNLTKLSERAEALASFCRMQRTLLGDGAERGDTNPGQILATLRGMVEKEQLDPQLDEMAELLQESVEGAARIQEIVRTMCTFSQLQSSAPEPIDPSAVILGALRITQIESRDHIEVHPDLSELRPFLGQRLELQQVLVNLLANAAQAIKGRGHIWIRSFEADGRGVVEIEDDGQGIDPAILPHIFEPFFTTKDVGQGTGLGLAISYQLLERMGARISVRPADGGGTVFRVDLPFAAP
jgi:PAS domain S-box-containing protein